MPSFDLPAEYGYVVLAATSTFFLNTAHSANTGIRRKAANVDYPAAYAPESNKSPEAQRFNCAQRAHANYIENQVSFVPALLIAGTKFPLTSAVMGLCWNVSRYTYMVGYSTGGEGGKGRYKMGGLYFWLFQFGLMGMAAYTGVSMVMGW
ncbi:hypothetical protein BP5796_10036 [Coleophoma crateriformis]|uniref:Uncharacterized protein n=1 Tax=Coleophoma crateriformis TaxID=565419 RepID=A0A3D8QV19_9HELO|nr:hypothetical protein BP5796_10036 [Coleophoma crateriformis]